MRLDIFLLICVDGFVVVGSVDVLRCFVVVVFW